ncbi:MAG: RraA family protein [Methanobacteriaceae archaeon]|jgi:3-hexulose-6-phosphate synthase|nr:RraA family protein [Methanobacteriaceae archaeon]MDO9626947.1 RraA family protein [Methanobacteriaceae archaeon]
MSAKNNKDHKNSKISPNSLLRKFSAKKTKSKVENLESNTSKTESHRDKSEDEFTSFESFFDAVKKAADSVNMDKTLDFISTPQISDALQKINGSNGVIPYVKSVNCKKTFGRVLTVQTNEIDWGTSVKAIDEAKCGEILFINVEGYKTAIWGELTSKAAQKKGISGTIINGACRDFDAIKNMNYPVFSKAIVPNAGKPLLNGKINIDLCFDGIEVNSGDYILGDECGVVVIPQKIFDDVIKSLWEIKNSEKRIIALINDGKSLLEILKLN